MTNIEVQLVKELVEQLETVQAFLVNRDNKKILETINQYDSANFYDSSLNTFYISKSRIRFALTLGDFALKAEGVRPKE